MEMEPLNQEQLAAFFRALGDPVRLRIFEFLRRCSRGEVEMDDTGACRPAGSASVGDVCCRVECSESNVSHHLKELRLAGLVRTEKRGRWIYCSVCPDALARIHVWAGEPGDPITTRGVCCDGY